ncbi:MAG: hypothetical protein H6717_31925 [Polyangiaceae bacterium]|nr:hypothetical protein [Polyangiaceae bacterium]
MHVRKLVQGATLAVLLSGAVTACGGADGSEEATEQSVQEPITVLDNCATGANANAIGYLTNAGAVDAYTRTWQQIVACKIMGSYSPTTIVDFNVNGVLTHTYDFYASPQWTVAPSTKSDCEDVVVALRVQRRNTTTGAWENFPGNYKEKRGSWQPFVGCVLPGYVSIRRINSNSYGQTETNRYRARAVANQPNGTNGSITITGVNRG